MQGISKFLNPWLVLGAGIAVVVVTPLGVILASLAYDATDVWTHLAQTVLAEVTINTLWLVLGVGLGTALLGVTLAWLMVFYEFPGRTYLEWFLMLPLAIPTYVLGFVWIGILDFSAPVPTLLRDWVPASVGWLPEIRSCGGVIFVMTLALYPYVYLLARNAFQTQGKSVLEAAKSLGMSHTGTFFKISIPMAKPWILGGLMLVAMETLADFGTVSVFNYDTFTTAIYKVWFGMFSLAGAQQLSSVLIMFVFCFLILEHFSRGRRGYALGSRSNTEIYRTPLRGKKMILVYLYPFAILLVAFILPVFQLASWGLAVLSEDLDARYIAMTYHTLVLACLAAFFVVITALLLSYAGRRDRGWGMQVLTKVATMGYAVPGTVLAVGIFSSLVGMDHLLISSAKQFLGIDTGMLLTGTLAAMVLAYSVRFLRVGFSPIESAMQRVTLHVEEAARNLGFRGLHLISKIYVPIMRGGLITAALLVFVDVLKEMPISLMTRPFGWDTLSVRIFEMTAEGEWQRAALPSLVLVLTGFIPVFLLTQRFGEGKK